LYKRLRLRVCVYRCAAGGHRTTVERRAIIRKCTHPGRGGEAVCLQVSVAFVGWARIAVRKASWYPARSEEASRTGGGRAQQEAPAAIDFDSDFSYRARSWPCCEATRPGYDASPSPTCSVRLGGCAGVVRGRGRRPAWCGWVRKAPGTRLSAVTDGCPDVHSSP